MLRISIVLNLLKTIFDWASASGGALCLGNRPFPDGDDMSREFKTQSLAMLCSRQSRCGHGPNRKPIFESVSRRTKHKQECCMTVDKVDQWRWDSERIHNSILKYGYGFA
jgi:hypothetical protein